MFLICKCQSSFEQKVFNLHNLRPSGTVVSKRSVMEDVNKEDVFQPNKRFRKARRLDEESGCKNKSPTRLFEEWKIQ